MVSILFQNAKRSKSFTLSLKILDSRFFVKILTLLSINSSSSFKQFEAQTLASGIDVVPTFVNFGFFFQALQPYQRVHKGYLDGYYLHRTCVFKALRLFFLPNFPGPRFIPCPKSILEARVNTFTKIIFLCRFTLNSQTENLT